MTSKNSYHLPLFSSTIALQVYSGEDLFLQNQYTTNCHEDEISCGFLSYIEKLNIRHIFLCTN